MEESCDAADISYFYLPPEILQNIFTYLPAKTLIRCREVNSLWKAVVDGFSRNQNMWRRNCKDDFPRIYHVACTKAKPGLHWFNLYRSLSLWRVLKDVVEDREDASCAQHSAQFNFSVHGVGAGGIFKKECIILYDIETLDLSNRRPIMGDYSKYTETENAIVILSYNQHLFVVRKVTMNENDDQAATYDNIKQFTLTAHDLYFVNLNDELFVIHLRCRKLHANFLVRSLRKIIAIGFSDGHLNVLTVKRHILRIERGNALYLRGILNDSNLVYHLQKYQFLENMDWQIFYQWMSISRNDNPEGPLRDVVTIRQYGDIYLVGSNSGILRMYYAPTSGGRHDIFKTKPKDQFNFSGHDQVAAFCACSILNVDVMEGIDGDAVIIAMSKKVTVLNFAHNFEGVYSEGNARLMSLQEPEQPDIGAGTSRK